MIAIIVISFLTLIGAVFTIYFWQQTPSDNSQPLNPDPRFKGGLFDHPDASVLDEERQARIRSGRQKVLERARGGDLSALDEAHSTDAAFYAEALDAQIEWATARQENLAALVSHVSKSKELRANNKLAQLLIETWKSEPDRRSTTEMVHIAALSDDPETYGNAVQATIELWRSGKLPWFTPEELADLLVSQYWLVSPEARSGGVGFALKRSLLNVRRELATAASTL